MENRNLKAVFAYLAVCFFWGSTYIAIRIGVKDLPPMLFASIRFIIAGSIMFVFTKIKRFSFPDNFKETAKLSLVGLILIIGGNGLLVIAEQWIHSGIASLIVATIPLNMTIIEIFILKQKKIGLMGIIGLILGFGGVIFLSISGGISSNINIKGVILLLLASLSWSIGSIYSKTIKTKCSMAANISIQMLAGGLGLLIIGLISGEASQFKLTLDSSISLLYLIFFGSIIGYSCYIYVLSKWSASKVGTYAYINPIVAVILGAVILHEPITYNIIISLVIIILGVILVHQSKMKKIL